jgi:hypothetical protein
MTMHVFLLTAATICRRMDAELLISSEDTDAGAG